jgi:hypothetical protein
MWKVGQCLLVIKLLVFHRRYRYKEQTRATITADRTHHQAQLYPSSTSEGENIHHLVARQAKMMCQCGNSGR